MPPGTWLGFSDFGMLSETAAAAEEAAAAAAAAERLRSPVIIVPAGRTARLWLWPPAAALVFALTIDGLLRAFVVPAEPGRKEERIALLIAGLLFLAADRIAMAARTQPVLR